MKKKFLFTFDFFLNNFNLPFVYKYLHHIRKDVEHFIPFAVRCVYIQIPNAFPNNTLPTNPGGIYLRGSNDINLYSELWDRKTLFCTHFA